MKKTIRILSILLLLSGALRAEEAASVVSEDLTEKPAFQKESTDLEGKVNEVIEKALAVHGFKQTANTIDNEKFSDKKISEFAQTCVAKALEKETVEEQEEFIANIDTTALIAALVTSSSASTTEVK